jgi:hypothetical protein
MPYSRAAVLCYCCHHRMTLLQLRINARVIMSGHEKGIVSSYGKCEQNVDLEN